MAEDKEDKLNEEVEEMEGEEEEEKEEESPGFLLWQTLREYNITDDRWITMSDKTKAKYEDAASDLDIS